MQERAYKVNGIDLYTFTNPYMNSFCVSVYVRAGSMFETDSDNGITHLLEHCVYRNLKKHYGGEFYDLLSLNGLDFYGCTYKEFLCFSIDGPASGIDFATDLLGGLFNEISINADEYAREKARIKAEIREKDEKSTLDYLYNKSVWCGTSAEKGIIGSSSVLDRISLKRLNRYRDTIFSKGNFFVCVTGNVENEAIEKMKNRLSELDINPNNPNFENEVELTESFFNRSGEIRIKQDCWTYIKIGFDVDTQRHSGGVHDLIYAILFKGDNALIYNTLSENNPFIYSYDCVYEQYNNVGNMALKFEVEEDKTEEAFKLVVETLNKLKNGEFNFEANYQCELAAWKMLQDNAKDLNWSLAYYNHILKTDRIYYSDKCFGRLSGITEEQIMQSAKEIFVTSNMTVAMKGSKRKINVDRIREILSGLDRRRMA